ncbi:MAG: hypothetical protein HY779_04195 [Rubrobacteridae bacterium]|nr:hypothetical protein [Rubrobacteridae bacterium]
MSDKKYVLRTIAFVALAGLVLVVLSGLTGCQSAPTNASGDGPQVLFFSSDT